MRADIARAVGDRGVVLFGKDLFRDLVADRFEDSALLPARQAGGRVFGVLKIAAGTGVLVIKEVGVHPLKVEGVVEGHTHPPVAEKGALNIEHEGLHRLGDIMGNFLFYYVTLVEIGPVIQCCPVFGYILPVDIIFAGLEGLEGDILIAVVVVADEIEV